MTMPNDADPMRDGPIDPRLAWKEPTQLVLTQPTNLPRNQAAWDSVCVATDFGTGRLQGDVGTAENPQFTYEEAVHNRRSGRSMTLHKGEDIVQLGSDELLSQSGPKLKRLRLAVEEATLPLLPQGVLPGGWDALGCPWALMDCPADQVPQIPSVHGHSRVTVAVFVSFHPEPLYFPDLAHMDRAIKVWNKASQRKPLRMNDELHADGRIKGPRRTYERLLLPGYRHSMPVQEAMKEARWPDFREGCWGNRENPPAPEGDVRPAPTQEADPVEEQVDAAASTSALSQHSVTRSVSPTKTSYLGTLASGTLRIVIPASDADSTGDEMSVSASPPRLPNSQDLATDSMTDAVTTSAIHHQQAEDEAAAFSAHSQDDRLSGRQSPGLGRGLGSLRTSCQKPEESVENDSGGARPRVEQSAVVPVETHTWEEVEGAVWQKCRRDFRWSHGVRVGYSRPDPDRCGRAVPIPNSGSPDRPTGG